MRTTLTCFCGKTESAEGDTDALVARGWREFHARHCATCECECFACPTCAPFVEAFLKAMNQVIT